MDSRIFVGGTIATKEWRKFVKKALWFLLFMPVTLLVIPIGMVWLVSFGHLNLLGIWTSTMDKVGGEAGCGGVSNG